MTLAPPLLVRCPHCPTIFIYEDLASITTMVEERWSDGWADVAPFNPNDRPLIHHCHRCNRWMWIEDLLHLLEVPSGITARSIPEVETVASLSLGQLTEALQQEWTAEQERALRIQLLWLDNHPRRRGESANELSHRSMENLERLAELVNAEEEPLLAAEIHRELGDFEAAAGFVVKAYSTDATTRRAEADLAAALSAHIAARSIAPFAFEDTEEEDETADASTIRDVRRRLDEGLYLFPALEDVYAFPSEDKLKDDSEPILSIRLDRADPARQAWATIIGSLENRHVLRFGRLFRGNEWNEYQSAPDWWKRELTWFWSKRSTDFQEDGCSDEADRYFRMLYYLRFGLWEYREHLRPDEDEERTSFDRLYDDPALNGDYHRLFWMHHWGIVSGRIGHDDAFSRDIVAELREEIREVEERRNRRRIDAVGGLQYLETAGPSWFQGHDQTPMVDGRPCAFVGQIWLDYINAGFSLVYLFYDPVTGTVAQTYDYD